jgi:pyruvate/2-oxoglutarate dehydrogenase complex dihydrolipoamide dehydrogenase (E3) component
MDQQFDAIIIGTGQAGPPLAGRLTQAGWKVALIEKKTVGGSCVNTGCTPTKAMVASAKVAHVIAHSNEYGLDVVPQTKADLKAIKARKDKIVGDSRAKLEAWIKGMEGCTLIRGAARFESADRVRVNEATLTSRHIFINVGERPHIPAFPGIDSVPYLTSETILDLQELPEHLVIVGGSYVGLEFAQMFRRFGARVTVVEREARLLSKEDDDVSEGVLQVLAREGVEFRFNAECIRLEMGGGESVVHMSCTVEDPQVAGTHVLLAVGRVPNSNELGIAEAGLKMDDRGYIQIDDTLKTNVDGIWALGDCNGRGGFTHTSYNDFEIAAANLLDGDPRKVSDRIPVSGLFIDPPLARIGANEKELLRNGRRFLVGFRPMTKVNRAIEKGETDGFMKVLVDESSKHILGATIFGVGGDEAIHCLLTAMYANQPASLIARSMHIHPTVAELIPTVLQSLKAR